MNRTKMVVKASFVSLFMYVLTAILAIIRTGIFIKGYGSASNGAMQLSNQIFNYLVILESGLGAAYLFKMYKPFEDKNFKKVNALYKGLSKSLKKIATIMLILLIGISFIYPFTIKDNSISYLKISLILLLIGVKNIIPYYFYLSKKNLLYAYEKKYYADFIDGVINSLTFIVEIIMCILHVDLLITLSVAIIIFYISNYIYTFILKRECYEVLKENEKPSFEGNKMTKDILVHQVAYTINSATDSVILSIVNTLNSVTIYNAYNTIITFPIKIVNKLVDNLRASVGKKMINDLEGTYKVFNEALALSFTMSAIMSSLFVILANDFVTLWIGKEYTLDFICVIAFGLLLIHRTIIPIIYIARDGKGLYKESKNYTLAQTMVNIIISLLLVNKYGITGLLIGTLVSAYFVLIPFNYNLVYKKVFMKKNTLIYKLIINILYVSLLTLGIYEINNLLNIVGDSSWISFVIKAVIDGSIVIVITLIINYLFNRSFKDVLKRFLK